MKTEFKHILFSHLLVLIVGSAIFFGLASCDPTSTPPTLETQTYHLALSNGKNTSPAYPLTKELADKYIGHLNSCPVPLRVRTYEEYKKQYISKVVKKYPNIKKNDDFANKNVAGQHVKGYKIRGWPYHFIFIKSVDNPHSLMETYFHELGHYKCHNNKCSRCKALGQIQKTEHHALINALEASMKYDFPEVMESSLYQYQNWVNDYDDYEKYAGAVLDIQASPLWDKVKAYAKKHNLDIPTLKKEDKVEKKKTVKIRIIFLRKK